MNTLTIHESQGILSRIRNLPLFYLPLILIGGYALASLAYSLIMQTDLENRQSLQQHEAGLEKAEKADLDSAYAAQSQTASSDFIPDNPHQAYSAVDIASTNIYLLDSKSTSDYFSSSGGNYAQILDQWHYYFQDRGIKYAEIHETDLTSSLKPGILILPSTVAFGDRERTALASFEKRGGSVLVTWAAGARNDKGKWLGYDFLHEQFNIKITGEIAAQDNEKFLVVSGETPVAQTLPAGTRIWLGLDKVHEHPLRFSGGEHIAGRLMDVSRTPNVSTGNEAIVYNETDSSRRVYFGFSENSWSYEQPNIYTLLDDVFNWLKRRPDAYLANWPYPYRSAQILEMDTEQDYPNATNFADMLNSNGFSGTFYSLTSVAIKYPDVVRQLELKNEIAYHGDVHDAFKAQSREVQSKRLDTMQQELRPLVYDPAKLRGFRPPYELADQLTESLLFEKGFGHILANSDGTQAMLPYLSLSSPKDFRKGLIVLPRTQRDDMNFTKEKLNSQDMTKVMIEDFNQAREFGALGVLSVHSQTFAADSDVEQATARFLAYIKSSGDKTWVAPSGVIESWWRDRARLKFRLTGESKKMLLDVTLEEPALRWKSAIVVSNPARGVLPTISAAKAGMPQPQLLALDDYRTAIVFDALLPGHYSYYLSY
jgi:peptidoglycan/xylan/chitin deacetylase (PgdA/CDA1 family)